MKRHLFAAVSYLAAIASPFAAISVRATEPLPPLDAYICTLDGTDLNLRAKPDMNSDVIARLPNDSRVWLVAPSVGSWQPVATSGARGYVWAEYVCEPEIEEIFVEDGVPDDDDMMDGETPRRAPMRGTFPARCGDGENIRNVDSLGGLDVYARPSFEAEILANLNNGAAIEIVPTSATNADGSIWMPLEYPTDGYINVGQDEMVTNIVYCTRFYD